MDKEFTTAYVGLGSNLGDRAGNILLAVRGLMEASFIVNKLSAVYETEPLEIESETKFLNMVAEIRVTNIDRDTDDGTFAQDRVPARPA